MGVFRNERILDHITGAQLADALVGSPALDSNIDNLLWALDHFEGSMRPFAGAIEVIVTHFVSRSDGEAHRSWDGGTLAKLLLRLYEQAEDDPELRRRCLSAWDSLLEDGLWFEVLKHIDGTADWG